MSTSPARLSIPDAVLVVGGAVLVSFFDANHNVHNQVAHVLSVGQIDEETDQPILSVAYPDPAAPLRAFTSAKWHDGYKRDTGVLHFSHPRVKNGLESIAWGYPSPAGAFPALIPTPEGDGNRPYFERLVLETPANPSIEQAIAAQTGKAPAPTTQSPLVNEPQAETSSVETKVYTDGTTATGTAPLPDQSPAQQDAATVTADASVAMETAAEPTTEAGTAQAVTEAQ